MIPGILGRSLFWRRIRWRRIASFLSIGLFAHILFLTMAPFSLIAGPATEPTPIVIASPSHRNLKIVPFINLTGNRSLDYLESGLPQMILNAMTLPVFLQDYNPAEVLVDPAGRASKAERYRAPEVKQEKISSEKIKIRLEGSVYAWKANQGELVDRESGFLVAANIEADYLVQGRITGTTAAPVLELQFYDAVWGRVISRNFALSAANPYDETGLQQIRSFLTAQLPGLASGRIRVTSAKEGALVFLDDVYMGKTPLNVSVAPGKYSLRVSHEQCQDVTLDADLGKQQSYSVACEPAGGAARLIVRSEPEGAEVYLNVTRIGVTPLDVSNLPEGTHRIRISKEGYIDRFKGVVLQSDRPSTVFVEMEKGDTEKYYRDPGYVAGDWTRRDLGFGLLLQSLVLGGGWAYSKTRANDVRDSIRSQIPALAFTDVSGFSLYQFYQIEQNRLDAKTCDNRANLFDGAAIRSLA
ncbi:MAG: PEGA domain-containing protein, partial [Leptospiraceae bacterium]|nr:PEGA domain-containing protein [Leptospiraceae bacterium]